jgi:hypothetical protein
LLYIASNNKISDHGLEQLCLSIKLLGVLGSLNLDLKENDIEQSGQFVIESIRKSLKSPGSFYYSLNDFGPDKMELVKSASRLIS